MPRQQIKPSTALLVVAAFAPELTILRLALPRIPPAVRRRVALATVGVGAVEAAIGASRVICELRPQAVLLVGTAGVYPSFVRELAILQAVVVRNAMLLPQIMLDRHVFLPDRIPRQERLSRVLSAALARAQNLPCADVACPIAITRSQPAARSAAKLSGCALENLEVFAVARAMAQAKVPFGAVLGIANRVGPAGHREWELHGNQAAANACSVVVELLRNGLEI